MSYAVFGQYATPEPPSALKTLHVHTGETLHEVTHEPKCGVLDQSTLEQQGINTAELVEGAPEVDALGNCTANATVEAMSNVLDEASWLTFARASSYDDVVGAEGGAIVFYSEETHLTGTPGQEWPPTDCGSSGPYMFQALCNLKLVSSQRIAHGGQNVISLLQSGNVCQGGPFFNAWMTPTPQGFVDGNGSYTSVGEQINSGVAGGHETCISAIEKLTLTETGMVVPHTTIIRVRNSWGSAWGLSGSFLLHLSTLTILGRYFDFRQFVA